MVEHWKGVRNLHGRVEIVGCRVVLVQSQSAEEFILRRALHTHYQGHGHLVCTSTGLDGELVSMWAKSQRLTVTDSRNQMHSTWEEILVCLYVLLSLESKLESARTRAACSICKHQGKDYIGQTAI